MASHFRVVIKNCSGHELPSKDSNGYSDPYLCFDFDHYKVFKTEIVKKSLNPKWKFEKEFFYETKFRDRLHKKRLVIECWDWDRVGSDDYIGYCTIDLHTLAYGPVHHNLPLRDGQKPAGRIQFDLYMQEFSTVTINLRNLRLVAPDIDRETCLEYSYTRIEDKGKKDKKKDKEKEKAAKDKPSKDKDSKKKKDGANDKNRQKAVTPKAKHVTPTEAQFDNGPFSVQATLHDLVAEAIAIRVKCGKKSEKAKINDARGEMRLGPYISNYKVKDQDFTAVLSANDGSGSVGTVKGTISIENLPKSAQLIGGEHNETGCTGQLLLEDMPPPNNYLVKKSTKKAPTGDDGERIYVEAAYENQYAATDEDREAAGARQAAAAEKRRSEVVQATGHGRTGSLTTGAGSVRPSGPDSSDDDATNEYAHFPALIEESPDGLTGTKPAQHGPDVHLMSGPATREFVAPQQMNYTPQQMNYTPQQPMGAHYASVMPTQPLQPQPAAANIASPTMLHQPSPSDSPVRADSVKGHKRPPSIELPDPATLPLPQGWRRSRDPKSGKEYYQNDVARSTTWVHPEIERILTEHKAKKAAAKALMQQQAQLQPQGLMHAGSQPIQRQPSPLRPRDQQPLGPNYGGIPGQPMGVQHAPSQPLQPQQPQYPGPNYGGIPSGLQHAQSHPLSGQSSPQIAYVPVVINPGTAEYNNWQQQQQGGMTASYVPNGAPAYNNMTGGSAGVLPPQGNYGPVTLGMQPLQPQMQQQQQMQQAPNGNYGSFVGAAPSGFPPQQGSFYANQGQQQQPQQQPPNSNYGSF